MRLEGKSAIVTGSGNGIGRATALLFAEEGARVLVADIEDDPGNTVVNEINQAGGEAVFHHTDISDESSADSAIQAAVEAFGTVDILVNNAAAFVFGKIEDDVGFIKTSSKVRVSCNFLPIYNNKDY